MSHSRFFTNTLPDYDPGSRVTIDAEIWAQRIKHLVDVIVKEMPPTFDNCDGSLYVGCAGVAYMLDYLASFDAFSAVKGDYLTKAKNYTDVSLSYCKSKQSRDPPAAFLLGPAGVYAIGSLVYADMGQKNSAAECNKTYSALGSVCEPVDYLRCGSDELLVGRAGYLCGALLLNRKFGQVVSQVALFKICNSVIHSGKKYSKSHKSPSPLMYAYYDTEYLGAAHGLSGILQMLLCVPDFVRSNPDVESVVRSSVDFMLGLQQSNGNVPPAMDEVSGRGRRHVSEELVHWCHGGPGVVYLFAKAFLLWKDDKYLQACLKCGELTWQKGLLKKGPGICHGVAGSGYVFLLLYRLTLDEKHLHRALKYAEFIFTKEFETGAKRPDTPYSLYEGLSGTVCFLADLLRPTKAEFPFFDVFS